MGLSIDWSAILAPVLAKLIEALVNALLRWIEEQPTKVACNVAEGLIERVNMFQESPDKTAAAWDLVKWTRAARLTKWDA